MRETLDLSALEWRLARAPRATDAPDWSGSVPATVPGNILDDLHRAGLTPDPYVAENFRCCEWTADWTFWYRTEFRLDARTRSPSKVCLRFDGIDTFADVLVNDVCVGTVHNMFRRHVFDITRHVRFGGGNSLVVRIEPPVPSAHRWAESIGVDPARYSCAFFGFPERLYTRKAQMSFGWDQTPCILAGGLYRPVCIEVQTGPAFGSDIFWHVTDLNVAEKTAVLHIKGLASDADGGQVRVTGHCAGSAIAGTGTVADGQWHLGIPVTDARFWWPNGMGAPNQYDIRAELVTSDSDVADSIALRIGLRTIHVVSGQPYQRRMPREPEIESNPATAGAEVIDGAAADTVGADGNDEELCEVTRLTFVVNGRKVFIKGFDWQAPDALFGCVTSDRTRHLLEAARDSHANMLRIWGGGTVESDAFYKNCSELGLLVWQDFFFACAIYPREPGFIEEIDTEARDIVKRLAHHTCIGCWCGDNESDISEWRQGNRGDFDNPVNKKLLPEIVRELDPQGRYYHISSPSGGPHPMSMRGGDKRNWGAWDAQDNYRSIRRERARFISEGGCCSFPSMDSIRQFLPEQFRFPLHNATWRFHRGSLDRQMRCFYADERVDRFLEAFGGYATLEEAVEKSRFAQAWGMKFLAEVCRQQKYECGGVLLWKLTECWPCFDLGMIEYFMTEKPVLAYIRNAYAPIAVSFTQDYRDDDADIEAYCVNDTVRPVSGQLTIVAATAGKDEPVAAAEVACLGIDVPANAARRVHRFPCTQFDPDSTVFFADLGIASRVDEGADDSIVGAWSRAPKAAFDVLRPVEFDLRRAVEAVRETVARPHV